MLKEKKNELHALYLDNKISELARAKSKDMADNRYLNSSGAIHNLSS
jgi:uncharacterized protein YkwD